MFGKKTKRIEELESELLAANEAKFYLASVNDIIKNINTGIVSENSMLKVEVRDIRDELLGAKASIEQLEEVNHDLKTEIESLKSKLTRKKPIKKSAQ